MAQKSRSVSPMRSLDWNILKAIIVLGDLIARREAAERAAEAARTGIRFKLVRIKDVAPIRDDPPDVRALRATLKSLSRSALHELTALYFIGADRPPAPRFAAALAHARRMSDAGDVAYLMEKPLGEDLRAGLRRLGLREPAPVAGVDAA